MNNRKLWYYLLTLSFLYQVSFLFVYLTGYLVELNSVVANSYWITAGLLGVFMGSYIMFKVNINVLGKVLAFIVTFFGFGLIALLLLALGITSM